MEDKYYVTREKKEYSHTWDILIVFIIFIFSLSLRLYKINEWSFWGDEFYTIRVVITSNLEDLLTLHGYRYPLFHLLQKLLLPFIPGTGEGSYRFLAALFGAATVALVYWGGRRIIGKKPALISAVYLAIFPWHIYWSQCCRYYTLVSLLVFIAFLVFWWGVKLAESSASSVWAIIPGVISMFAHPSSAFSLIGMGVFMFFLFFGMKGPRGRRFRKSAIFFIGTCVTIFIFTYGILHTSLSFYKEAKPPNPFMHFPYTLGFYLTLPVLAVSVISYFGLRKEDSITADMIMSLIALPIGAIFVIGFFMRVTAQYVFYTLPFFILLAGWGTSKVFELLTEKADSYTTKMLGLIPFLVILLFLGSRLFLYYHSEFGWRPRWKEAGEFIKERWKDNDIVAAANADPIAWYIESGYFARKRKSRFIYNIETWNIKQRMNEILNKKDGGRVWMVLNLTFFKERDPKGVFLEKIYKNFRLVRILPVYLGPRDLSLLVFLRDPSGL